MTGTRPPICCDCTHVRLSALGHFGHKCARAAVNLVDGRAEVLCSDERAGYGWLNYLFGRADRCGPSGRHYEQRPAPTPPSTGGSPHRPERIAPPEDFFG